MTLYRVMVKLAGKKRFREAMETFDQSEANKLVEHYRSLGIETKVVEIVCE